MFIKAVLIYLIKNTEKTNFMKLQFKIKKSLKEQCLFKIKFFLFFFSFFKKLVLLFSKDVLNG